MATKVPRAKSKPEELFALQMKALKQETNAGYRREYQFKEGRKWRVDFAIPWKWVAIEIEGGIFSGAVTSGARALRQTAKSTTH